MSRSRPRRASLAAFSALAVLSLAGCQASVQTAMTVTSPREAQVHVAAEFTGEAAQVLRDNDAVRAQLEGVFADRAGAPARLEEQDGGLTMAADLSYDRLTAAAGVTGVQSAALSGDGDATVLQLRLGPAVELARAVRRGTAGQPDAEALTATMLASTSLAVSVTFPGGITAGEDSAQPIRSGASVDGTAPAASELPVGAWARWSSDDTITYFGRVNAPATQVRVTGDPAPHRLPWLIGGGVLTAAGITLAVRRRRQA